MHSALYTGRLSHRRCGPVPHAFSYGITLPGSTSPSSTPCSAAAGSGPHGARRSPGCAAPTTWAATHAAGRGGARPRRARDRPAPAGAGAAADPAAHAGLLLQPGELLLLLRRARQARRGDRRGDHQHALERATRLRAAPGHARRAAALQPGQVVPRVALHADGPRIRLALLGPGRPLAVHMRSCAAERVFDASLRAATSRDHGGEPRGDARPPAGRVARRAGPNLLAGLASLAQERRSTSIPRNAHRRKSLERRHPRQRCAPALAAARAVARRPLARLSWLASAGCGSATAA